MLLAALLSLAALCLSFAALLSLSFASVLLAALLCFATLLSLSALFLGFGAFMLLGAAIFLKDHNDLGGLHQLGANHILTLDHESLGAYGLCIESLGILNGYTGNFVGTGDDSGNFLLFPTTTSSGSHCGANCANKKNFFHN